MKNLADKDKRDKTKIQRERERAGLSRIELSRQSGVPLITLEKWEWEKRKPTKFQALKKIAEILGCKIEDLI
jgi:DNA-binding transcriptional regulator YiaG